MSVRDLPRLFTGSGLTVLRNALGNQLSWKPSATWRHPWYTSAIWNPTTQAWTASVVPGMVNGKPPMVALTMGTAPDITIERAKGNKIDTTNRSAPINVPLTDYPTTIPLEWRNIGADDISGNAIPAFFKAMGVNPGVTFDPNNPTGNTTPQNLPPNNRLLRACDFVVQQPRYSLEAVTTVGNVLAGDSATLNQTLEAVPPLPTARLNLYTTAQWVPTTATLDPSTGIYSDPPFDEILISTLYFLSPPGAPLGSAPDGSWTQYPQHNVFWNLGWTQSTKINQPPPSQLSFIIALPSGFLVQPLVDEILGADNDAIDQITTADAAQSLAGQFWTMGGCQALPAVASNPVSNYGLNKAARNAATAKAAKAAPAPLDPLFPYTGISFPTSIL